MKIVTPVAKIRMIVSRSLATQHPVKLVGILGLGAVLMAGSAVQLVPKSDEGQVNSPLVEGVTVLPKSMEVNTDNVVRVNESSGETFRLREQLRSADRQEDYHEMLRYWNQLKRNTESGTAAREPKAKESEAPYPDTPYYRDPDWREGKTVNSGIPVEESSDTLAAYHQRMERLEKKRYSLLAEALHNPSTSLLREIDRLDDQINTLQLSAMDQP
jgi:hypothetical protein